MLRLQLQFYAIFSISFLEDLRNVCVLLLLLYYEFAFGANMFRMEICDFSIRVRWRKLVSIYSHQGFVPCNIFHFIRKHWKFHPINSYIVFISRMYGACVRFVNTYLLLYASGFRWKIIILIQCWCLGVSVINKCLPTESINDTDAVENRWRLHDNLFVSFLLFWNWKRKQQKKKNNEIHSKFIQ